MKKFVSLGLGLTACVAGALAFLPSVQGATNVVFASGGVDLFASALDRVKYSYVREVDDSELISAAIEGMVNSLDPHSNYMDAKEFADMLSQTHGEFGGVGFQLTKKDGQITVISAIDNTPASRAGVKTGDVITGVDGIDVRGLPLKDVVKRMRGPENTKVKLSVIREDAPQEFTLTRAIIPVETVKYERKGDIGYIRVSVFNEKTDAGVKQAIADLRGQIGESLQGYVLDLRDDPGGLLDQAIAVSDDFLTGGDVVSTRGRNPADLRRYSAHAGDLADGKPLVVLINEGTASASEIVAGALQDHKRATIVGVTSYGKGSVQSILALGANGGALRLTTSRYYTPSGRSIQATGITPDVAVSNLTATEQAEADKSQSQVEAKLAGHLESEGAERNTKLPTVRPEEGKKYDDFQLSYVLERFNGELVAASHQKAASAEPASGDTTTR